MAYRRSLDFLPEVFRTKPNDKFLYATIDQLISEPELRRVDGYIGRKFSPVAGPNDSFVNEFSNIRQEYQLEPNTVYIDKNDKVKFNSAYIDLLRRIETLGGYTNNHSRLFESTFYTFDPFIDYDKFLNYNSYYWLPEGPDSVPVFAQEVPLTASYEVIPPSLYQVSNGLYEYEIFDSRSFDTSEADVIKVRQDGYKILSLSNKINPTIRLARGGTYTFEVNQFGHGFYIQTSPGTNDTLEWQRNLSAREIYGVENNGEDVGLVTFNVPSKDAQDFFQTMPKQDTAFLAAFSSKKNRNLRYTEVQNRLYTDIINEHSGIDGQRMLNGKSIVFLKDPAAGQTPQPWQPQTAYQEGNLLQYGNNVFRVLEAFTSGRVFSTNYLEIFDLEDNWYDPALFDYEEQPFDSTNFDKGISLNFDLRRAKFTMTVNSVGRIVLKSDTVIDKNKKIEILEGIKFGNREIYRDANDDMLSVPTITANLDRLYYTDSIDPNIGGVIEIIDQDFDLKIDVENSIIGKENYESPNGIKLTNGLKVKFLDDVIPTQYANKNYYVEGVGSAIKLIPEEDLITNETWLDTIEIRFDADGFDAKGYSSSTNSPLQPEYFVINRGSQEISAWVRQNRWFHEDIITLTAKYNNFSISLPAEARAKRPIIEFDHNLQLMNFGGYAKKPVDVIDFSTTDAFSNVEGQAIVSEDDDIKIFSGNTDFINEKQNELEIQGYVLLKKITTAIGTTTIEMKRGGISTYYVDGVPLVENSRVIFAADTDPDVRNKIYRVEWIKPQDNTDDKFWTFTSDSSTILFDLNYNVTDPDRLKVFINGVKANDLGYYYVYDAGSQTIGFTKRLDDSTLSVTTIPPGANITVSLVFDKQLHLVLEPDGNILENDCVLIKQGLNFQGTMCHYLNGEWKFSQQKTQVNQPPMFDLFDESKRSYADSYYTSTNFKGNKLFGYALSNGVKDPVLNIRLKYKNLNNIGDIVFTDYITTESFVYRQGQQSITKNLIGSRVKENHPDRTFIFRNQWRQVRERSRQFQLQSYFANDYQKNLFKLNVLPAGVGEEQLSNIVVYVNNRLLYTNNYDIQKEDNNGYLLLDKDLNVGDKIDIKIYSETVPTNTTFEVPASFTNNPLNEEIEEVTLGQFRSHLLKCIEVIPSLSDELLTENNLRDLGNIKSYGGSLLQHAGSTHLANFFLNDGEANFVNSMIFAQREYVKFKNRFLELVSELNISNESPVATVDRVLSEMSANKNKNFAFFTSDMVAFGSDYKSLKYTIVDNRLSVFDLSEIFDRSKPSNKSVLVYRNGEQLIVDTDFTFSIDSPTIELNLDKVPLAENDIIEIKEYVTTDGSFMPPSPTKLGLYPSSIPEIDYDGYGETQRPMIKGHDGSLTTLFGDIRDKCLIELERRIFNNLKVKYNKIKFDYQNYIPGAFRKTRYTLEEFNSILSSHFSAWSGKNAVSVSDYRNFEANNPFTYNYGRFTNRIDGTIMPVANWRGIYHYYYDTDTPHMCPWEMLGFAEKPSWWEETYGVAPYTSGNKVLWDDLEAGLLKEVDTEGNRPAGIDVKFARPGLSRIIPVNESGELLSPMDCVAKDINTFDVSGFFKFGDEGPVEAAWRQSSEYPFVLQIAMAIMHPSEYFGVNIDVNYQIIDPADVNQLVFSDTRTRKYINRSIQNEIVNDEFYRSNSYITYISEYCKSKGLNISTNIGDKIRNLQVKLGYKVGGYTDKKFLKILTDQYTPASNNPGVVIPDDDFDLVLSKSAPINNLTYSGVIITKTADGYAVTGYDDNKPYFVIEETQINDNKTVIKVGNLAVTKYKDGTGDFFRVPYGTEFFGIDQVADFLISYGRYLTRLGFVFDEKLDEDASWYLDWDLAVREFLFYVQQNWDVDIALTLSPVGKKINYRSLFGTVDSISNRPLNTRVLDEDFKIIRSTDYFVYRNGRNFDLTINDERGVYLLDIDVVEYEHVLLFNNSTRFNDVIYDPITGDRQHRLRLQGFKTGDWDGTYSAAGFIINDNNIEEWKPGVNYKKGDIVLFNSDYYTALEDAPANITFGATSWSKTEYGSIKAGILPNLANKTQLIKSFYNVNEVNLEQDAQRLSKELIGFEFKPYMEDLSISDTSQFKFYQGMISQKGTKNSFDKLLNARVDNFGGYARIFEEWAFRVGNYGATGTNQFVDLILKEEWAFKDPLVLEFLDPNDPDPIGHKGIKPADIWFKNRLFTKNYLGTRDKSSYPTDLYSAGYANIDDVDYLSPSRAYLNNYINNANIGRGDLIWIASDIDNQWNIYRVNETNIRLKTVNIIADGTATVVCQNNHNFVENDLIYLYTPESNLKGFYTVGKIISNTTFTCQTGFGNYNIDDIKGSILTLKSVRYQTASNVVGQEPLLGWQPNDRIFIDKSNNEEQWAIYENQTRYEFNSYYRASNSGDGSSFLGDGLGQSVAADIENYYLIAGRPTDNIIGGVIIYSITNAGTLEEVASLSSDSENTIGIGTSVTASNEVTFASGAPYSDETGFVFIFSPSATAENIRLNQVIASPNLDNYGEFGYSVKLSDDGNWLAVGQPGLDEGYVHVYQRKIVKTSGTASNQFVGDGSTTAFILTGAAANPQDENAIAITVNGVIIQPLTEYTVTGSTVDLLIAPPLAGTPIVMTVTKGLPEQTIITNGIDFEFILTGDNASPASIYALYVELNGKLLVPFRDYTLNEVAGVYSLVLANTPAIDLELYITQRTNYALLTTFTGTDGTVGDGFGSSLAWSDNGRELIVGAPYAVTSGTNSGKVYIYDRTAENFIGDAKYTSYTTSITIEGNPVVYVNGIQKKLDFDYEIIAGDIVFFEPPAAGSLIRIETNNFIQNTVLDLADASEDIEAEARFGEAVDICPTNCSVYIGAPGSDKGAINCGKVLRFINQGRLYGTVQGTVKNPTISEPSLITVNNFAVELFAFFNLENVVDQINLTNIPGVTAFNNNGYLLIESNSLVTGEKLLISSLYGKALIDLGIEVYVHQQTIAGPDNEDYTEFGKQLQVGPDADILVISSDTASTRLFTTFDSKTTLFDSKLTNLTDKKYQSGAVWLYQALSIPDSSSTNPIPFIPAQKLVQGGINELDGFGASIAINKTSIYVGAPFDDTDGKDAGIVFSFTNSSGLKPWTKIAEDQSKVHINLIKRIFLHSIKTNQIVSTLDYVDPIKGKILGLAEQEISYKTAYDPANYSEQNKGRPWGKDHTGEVWWDISQTRWLNYENGEIPDRAINWNSAFPGSTIICYEWIESDLPPNLYVDTANPSSYARSNRYNLLTEIDPNTNIVTNKYYYWVAGKQTFDMLSNRKFSTIEIEGLIANPRGSGVPYIAFLSPSSFALYNISSLLNDNNIVLRIEYDTVENERNIHSEFQLLAENDATSLPNDDLVTKVIDSLAGTDYQGNKVPDIKLTPGEAYGTLFRPRQSVFTNRQTALKAAVEYVNLVLASIPSVGSKDLSTILEKESIPEQSEIDFFDNSFILQVDIEVNKGDILILENGSIRVAASNDEIKSYNAIGRSLDSTSDINNEVRIIKLTINYDEVINNKLELSYLNNNLFQEGYRVLIKNDEDIIDRWTIYQLENSEWKLIRVQSFDCSRYIERIDWINPNYVDPIVTDYVVDYSYELVSITPNINDTVKVKDAGNGRYQILIKTATGYDIVKEEKGTIKITDSIWNENNFVQNFDNETFDLQIFDDWPTVEIQKIMRAAYDYIFTEEQAIEKNKWFLIMVKYLLAEQKYVDWAFKTSFVKVEHRNQQAISQIASLQKDRQSSLEQYITEVKPYHTKIREFVTSHEGFDDVNIGTTDFDVPSYYNEVTGKYTSVTGRDEIDRIILTRPEYQAYVNNYTLEVDSIIIYNGGSNFTAPPELIIEGGNGKNTKLETTIINGEITNVKVLNPGTDYITTPTISIAAGSGGENAYLVPVMGNKKVRKIKDVIKLDRTSNNGGFLVTFLDQEGNPVNIRNQRKDRYSLFAGVIDELLNVLTDGRWIVQVTEWLPNTDYNTNDKVYYDEVVYRVNDAINSGANFNPEEYSLDILSYPVEGASNYRIFDDSSGRIQVQYKKTPGGLTASILENSLRALGEFVGVNELDISGTTVVEDGNMTLYSPTVLEWLPNTRYDIGDIIVHSNKAYTPNISFISGETFELTNLRVYDASEFENHLNRTWAYYQPKQGLPGRDLGQLFNGVEYPGVKVIGPSFRDEPGFDVGNFDSSGLDQYLIGPEGVPVLDPKVLDQTIYSNFLDTTLGTRPDDIITLGGEFVDIYNSHAPEEMIPGRVYDTVDIRVYSSPSRDLTNSGIAFSIISTAYPTKDQTLFSYKTSITGGDDVLVFSKNIGRLDEDIDYTVSYKNKTVTLITSLLDDDLLYIYAYNSGGDGLLYEKEIVVANTTVDTYIVEIEYNLINQSYVTLNGKKQTDYTLTSAGPGLTHIEFGPTVTLTVDDVIYVNMFNTESELSQHAGVQTNLFVANGSSYPDDYTFTLDNDLGYSNPLAEKIIVELNNGRLRPPIQAYYEGDDSTTVFSLPFIADLNIAAISNSTVIVTSNGVVLNQSLDYTLSENDGSTLPTVTFTNAPAIGDKIIISVTNVADYLVIDANTVLIKENIDISAGDKIRVTSFTNHEKLDIKTKTYIGTTEETVEVAVGFDDVSFDSIDYDSVNANLILKREYELIQAVTSTNRLWVSLDVDGENGGSFLQPNFDYELTDGGSKIRLSNSLTIIENSRLVITQFGQNEQKSAIGFRLFKDLNDKWIYLRISGKATTKLTQTLNITDREIYVQDASILASPSINLAVPGSIMIGGEKINYFGIDKVNNKLFNIRRGVDGTGAIQTIPANSIVQDAGISQRIPNAEGKIWYSPGDGTLTNGLGLQYSTTEQAKFLLAEPTLLISQVFDEAFVTTGYVTNGYVEGNLY